MRLLFAFFLIFTAFPCLAIEPLTEHGINTPAFMLRFPEGWSLLSKQTPVPLVGPNTEHMLISPIVPDPDTKKLNDKYNSTEIQDFWRERIKPAITRGITENGMKIDEPFKESTMHGMQFLSGCSHTSNEKAFLCIYGLIGKGGAVIFLTVEGRIENETSAKRTTLNMLESVEWKKQSVKTFSK